MSDNTNRPGFLPNGGGNETTYGRNPEGVAYNKDGTLRKKRTAKTIAERKDAIAAQYQTLYATAGRQALSAYPGMSDFDKAASQVRGAISAAKRSADLGSRLADLQRQMDEAPAQAEVAQEYLDSGPEAALDSITEVRTAIGKACIRFAEDNMGAEAEGDDLQSIVDENIPEGALDTVREAAANDWRGDDAADDDATEDSDTL